MMYTNCNGYLVPNLSLPNTPEVKLNRYGRMRLEYRSKWWTRPCAN